MSYKGVFTTEIIVTADHVSAAEILCYNPFHYFPVAFLEKVFEEGIWLTLLL